MRALFRPFVLHAAYTPIETIVFFCIVGTLCYFHILSAIKNSSFLDPAPAVPLVVKPAWAVHRAGEWVGVRESVWTGATKAADSEDTVLELQQVIVNLDAGKAKYMETSEYQMLSLTQGPLSLSVHNLSEYLTTSFRSPAGRVYSAVCHVAGDKCFDAQQIGSKTFVQTLAFKPGMREEWMSALIHHDKAARTFVDETGVRFEIDLPKMGGESTPLGQMRNGRWVAYAARSLVIRFWDLAKKADSLDILLILAGYILMHTTFYLLLIRSRSLGSSFWLPLAILSSSVLALLISLPIAMALKIPIDPVALTEALPFLVCTVGFDKPLRLARAVFLHPHLTVPPSMAPGENASGYPVTASASKNSTSLAPPVLAPLGNSQALKPAPKIITESLTLVYVPIIRDYVLEVAVLTVGAYSKVGGLKEVCALAALLLSVDCLLMCTYLAAIFGVMVEVRRIKTVRAMTRSRSNSITSSTSSAVTARLQSAMSRPQVPPPPPTLRQRLSRVLFGEKGNSLPGYAIGGLGYGNAGARGGKAQKIKMVGKGKDNQKQENPVARLKLLLIASFLTLHILNLITPLTPTRHSASPSSSLNAQVNIRKVDITASGLRAVFNALVDASPVGLPHSSNDSIDDASLDLSTEIFVKVLPPIYMRAVPSRAILSSSSAPITLPGSSATLRAFIPKSASERVESFMSAWTRLVGDPILSKWITILLAISITLNGYLLKGIAAGVVGVRLSHFGVRGGVRFEDDHHEAEETHEVAVSQAVPTADDVPVAPPPAPSVQRIEHQSAPREIVAAVPTFTLEDVDKKLQIAKANSRRLTITATSARAATAAGSAGVSNITPPSSSSDTSDEGIAAPVDGVRDLEEIVDIFENGPRPLSASLALLNDEEVILLCQNGKIAAYALEKVLGMNELERAVKIRRALISRASKTQTLESSDIPLTNYDYSRVLGACCENVVGFIPLPLGIAGPLNIDGNLYPIPMATAEGTLVASTSRGCKALNAGGGVTTVLTQDAMTRGPAIDFPSITMAAHAKMWIDSGEGYTVLKAAFESTSRFARLKSLKTAMAGRTLFVRFATATGDAMGMNMISKGTEKALEAMQNEYPAMVVLALSGNYCTDKKPAAINWIEGRGKSVVAEAVIPGKVVKSVLKTTVASLVNLNTKKNLVGSAMAGSIGGFNAHAANILTAIFIATGQDPAQNVESSMCMTLMEATNDGEDLLMTVSMPCIEVGTVGGGTVLGPQQGVLDMLGMRGAHPTHPGTNAQALARLIAAAVMAGELSLLSALAAGHLIRAHMAHNRSTTNTPAASAPPTPGAEIVEGRGHGQLAPEGGEKEKTLPLLTPSPSTNSLPSYSQ